MLRSLKDLERYSVSAIDGDIGHVANFYLDDERWIIRYLVVNTFEFLDGRQVLISPISFRQIEWLTHQFHLGLTMAKIEHCPSTDMDKPVSRQHEDDYNQYYGYPSYWWSSGLWGMDDFPAMLVAKRAEAAAELADSQAQKASYDVHLRSTNEVRGYHIQGSDEAIGHVEDFIVDDETWEVRYLVIDTSNWWFGKKVLVAPQWTSSISWEEKTVHIDMTREAIRNSPEWDPSIAIQREYEAQLHDHFGRQVYWRDGARKR
jgi:hypothetical protein